MTSNFNKDFAKQGKDRRRKPDYEELFFMALCSTYLLIIVSGVMIYTFYKFFTAG